MLGGDFIIDRESARNHNFLVKFRQGFPTCSFPKSSRKRRIILQLRNRPRKGMSISDGYKQAIHEMCDDLAAAWHIGRD